MVAFAVVAVVAACAAIGYLRLKPSAPAVPPKAAQPAKQAPERSHGTDDLPRPEPLTVGMIHDLPDDLLESGAATQVEYLLRQIPGPEEEAARKLPRGMRMIYTTINLQAEVENGGFNQYFWNTQGALDNEVVEDFELIGARHYADLVERAIVQARKEAPMRERFRRIGTPDAFSRSYEYSDLGKYDAEFLKLEKQHSLTKMRADYIRAHPEEFATG
ncbi:MAG: DUF4375 domain-containing protein [Armatimonadetes bacterium]|nr:DUF4375 domain-containing protein [Armatimonadota bacterium]